MHAADFTVALKHLLMMIDRDEIKSESAGLFMEEILHIRSWIDADLKQVGLLFEMSDGDIFSLRINRIGKTADIPSAVTEYDPHQTPIDTWILNKVEWS